jgi:uncharacterized protein affecting Mg2+/Co2+ transport
MELKIDNCLASNFTYATDDKIAMLNAAQIKNFFTNGICKGGVSKEHLDGKIKIHLNSVLLKNRQFEDGRVILAYFSTIVNNTNDDLILTARKWLVGSKSKSARMIVEEAGEKQANVLIKKGYSQEVNGDIYITEGDKIACPIFVFESMELGYLELDSNILSFED